MEKADSVIQWLDRVKGVFSFFDGFFLTAVQEGSVWIWPPSLTHYPCPGEISKQKEVFRATADELCFFRVCQRTLMPYHGYVVPSPVHDRLYAVLKTRIPEHVTLLPILSAETVVALLYMERKTVEDLSTIPSLAAMELQWDTLSYLFSCLYKLKQVDLLRM